ncbi:FtsB family cell division protein [Sphingomonas japonica]|uniref:Cell division protein FtsB n=1 Tax=Sphingomonas japonica TaxID=511662 RepID=A0ABX0U713_9SPHN|nr:septum formation initiator family protein [Sphingomonas japonica]NIJ24558.1 cell division protein FtsB [Sphingomonas japonica]
MSHLATVTGTLRRAGLPALAIIVMGFFVYSAVVGPNGVIAYRDYHRQLDAKNQQFAALDQQRAELRNRVAQIDPRHANPDMVDELVRKELNVVHPDEVIVPLD